MGKKITTNKIATAATPISAAPVSPVVKTSPARNSPVPKAASLAIPTAAPAKKEVTRDMIAKLAFEISMGSTSGDELSNWLRAERELKGL